MARFRAEAGRFRPKTCQDGSILASLREVWCGRGDLNPHDLLGSADFHTTSAFAAPPGAGSWSGLYLHHSPWGLGAARLVSTPSRKRFRAWLGIAISGFPDFEQFYAVGFPMGTQVLKSAASAISPRPREIGY